jgi:PTH1 family peptidyl-tRNA hydrolase
LKLIVGLGNPGPKYELTRHNAGFLVIDCLVDDHSMSWDGEKFKAAFAKGSLLGESCIFLKPLQFMNLSGRSVAEAMRFFKLDPSDLVVLHDDIDVPSGKVKAKVGGGHGGHNGIRNIIDCIGSRDFHRIKLGVGRPPSNWQGADWVLAKMADEEIESLQSSMLKETLERIEQIFKAEK